MVQTAPRGPRRFRITGLDLDVRESQPFALPARRGDLTLDVALATGDREAVGVVVIGLGIVGSLVGVGTMLAGFAENLTLFCLAPDCDARHDDVALVVGAATFITGIVTALVGGVLVHVNAASRVRVALGPAGASVGVRF